MILDVLENNQFIAFCPDFSGGGADKVMSIPTPEVDMTLSSMGDIENGVMVSIAMPADSGPSAFKYLFGPISYDCSMASISPSASSDWATYTVGGSIIPISVGSEISWNYYVVFRGDDPTGGTRLMYILKNTKEWTFTSGISYHATDVPTGVFTHLIPLPDGKIMFAMLHIPVLEFVIFSEDLIISTRKLFAPDTNYMIFPYGFYLSGNLLNFLTWKQAVPSLEE